MSIIAGGVITIPGSLAVLPNTPTPLTIIGNNWLNRAKSIIDFVNGTLNVTYKKNSAKIPIFFVRGSCYVQVRLTKF